MQQSQRDRKEGRPFTLTRFDQAVLGRCSAWTVQATSESRQID